MYRLFPIFVIFFVLSFVISFVGYLTPIKYQNSSVFVQQKTILEEKKITEERESNYKINEMIENSDLVKINEKKEKIKKSKILENNLIDNKTNSEIKSFFIIQFGAFSEKTSAIRSMEKINEAIRQKYTNFDIVLLFDEKKNIYRLIFKVEEEKNAKQICKYSKNLKFDCYVKNEKM